MARRQIDLQSRLAITTTELRELLGCGRYIADRLARQLGVQHGPPGSKRLISIEVVRAYLRGEIKLDAPVEPAATAAAGSEHKAPGE
jgi:hypothetical protein